VPADRQQAEPHLTHRELVLQPPREIAETLRERKAVHPQPQLGIDRFELGRQPDPPFDAVSREGQKILAAHLFQGPADLQALRGVGGGRVEEIGEPHRFVLDDPREAGPPSLLHPRVGRQVLARRADVGEPRPRPLDELLEQRDPLRLGVD
jgi:hypothetical protein